MAETVLQEHVQLLLDKPWYSSPARTGRSVVAACMGWEGLLTQALDTP